MNTERLYYADAYCADFAGRVLATRAEGDRLAVALDRTAFYPTGGGQPNDTGELTAPSGRAQVVDVTSDDDLVWHWFSHEVLAADWQAGTPVTGAVDWLRRFDHMQQHTGQHILSQAFIETCGAETVAFHLGVTYSTIDLARADLDGGVVAAAEGAANRVVDRALPVTAGYVTPEELAALPLRRAPKVTENIRIVQVAGFDWSACGGTHVANSSQVGLIKVTATERRGAELRVTFLCGGRARADYDRLHGLAQGLVARFTTGQDEILAAVDRRAAELDALRKELADLERQWVEAAADALWAAAESRGSYRVVVQALDAPAERVKRVAQALKGRERTVILLAARGERPQIFCARSDDLSVDAAAVLRVAVTAGGGRGGGRPDWAQGGVPANEALDAALQAGTSTL
jgi:alanyl-tRNA synthetase